jgi:hypothetical protein
MDGHAGTQERIYLKMEFSLSGMDSAPKGSTADGAEKHLLRHGLIRRS